MKAEYIRKYEILNNQINQLIEEYERWRAKAERSTPTLDGMPKSKGDNQREEAVCEMADCSRQIDFFVDMLCDLRKEVQRHIDTTGDKDKRLLRILEAEE